MIVILARISYTTWYIIHAESYYLRVRNHKYKNTITTTRIVKMVWLIEMNEIKRKLGKCEGEVIVVVVDETC